MTPSQDVLELRTLLNMNRTEFANLLGVDNRTIFRWEDGHSEPTGTARAVLAAFRETLTRRSPDHVAAIQETLQSTAKVGGLAYLIVYLLDDCTNAHLGEPGVNRTANHTAEESQTIEAKLRAAEDELAAERSGLTKLTGEIRELQKLLGVTRP